MIRKIIICGSPSEKFFSFKKIFSLYQVQDDLNLMEKYIWPMNQKLLLEERIKTYKNITFCPDMVFYLPLIKDLPFVNFIIFYDTEIPSNSKNNFAIASFLNSENKSLSLETGDSFSAKAKLYLSKKNIEDFEEFKSIPFYISSTQ